MNRTFFGRLGVVLAGSKPHGLIFLMLLRLHLGQFRCHEGLDIEPGRHSAFVGANGRGKTSILEAVFYLARCRSFRTSQNRELVMRGKKALLVRGDFEGEEFRTLRIEWSGAGRKLGIDALENATFREYWGRALAVVFKNEDRLLVQGAAALRRRWVDSLISALRPDYLRALQKCQLLLRQRGALLRQPRADRALWEVLVDQVDGLAGGIEKYREEFNGQAFSLAEGLYGELTGQSELLSIHYENDFEKALKISRDDLWEKERHLKTVLRGPHRSEWELLLNGKSLRAYGSEGQQKSGALTLRLAEIALLKKNLGRRPILLFDDVLNELDSVRRKKFWGLIEPSHQILFATTDESNLPSGYEFQKFQVEPGRVET